MKSKFRQVALIGKYQAAPARWQPGASSRPAWTILRISCRPRVARWCWKRRPPTNIGLTGYPVLDVAAIGQHCDLGLVVGGDGTMLGIGRQLARYGCR